MAKTLELRFKTANDKVMNLTIQNPKDNLTSSEVVDAMQKILDQNVFHYNGYELTDIYQARVVERNVTEIQFV